MTTREQTFDQLLSTIEKRDRASRRNAALLVVVPTLAALALLGYSGVRVARLQEQAEQRTAQIAALEEELAQARRQLEQTLDMSRYSHPVDMVDLKTIYSRHPNEARVLDRILDLRERGVAWRLGGQSPDQGFDSPSFAAYLLRESGVLNETLAGDPSLIAASRRLFETLLPTPDPAIGDLAFYPSGYVMFQFRDKHDRPFVIGMTPTGIAALEPDFAEPIGYRRPRIR